MQDFRRLAIVFGSDIIVYPAHQLACLNGYFHFFADMDVVLGNEKVKAVKFIRQISQLDSFRLAMLIVEVKNHELLKVAGYAPAGHFVIVHGVGIAYHLLHGCQPCAIGLLDALGQIFSYTFLLNDDLGRWNIHIYEAYVGQLYLHFKIHVIYRLFYAIDCTDKLQPEFLCFPLFIALALPLVGKRLCRYPLLVFRHSNHPQNMHIVYSAIIVTSKQYSSKHFMKCSHFILYSG